MANNEIEPVRTCADCSEKFLGQQNITNAYVSGMKEDLNAQGNELNYFVVACMSDMPCSKMLPRLTA
jgi:hypothetical protein